MGTRCDTIQKASSRVPGQVFFHSHFSYDLVMGIKDLLKLALCQFVTTKTTVDAIISLAGSRGVSDFSSWCTNFPIFLLLLLQISRMTANQQSRVAGVLFKSSIDMLSRQGVTDTTLFWMGGPSGQVQLNMIKSERLPDDRLW